MEDNIRTINRNGEIIHELEGDNGELLILKNMSFEKHILKKHPEICLDKLMNIVKVPDYIYKESRNSKVLYYEKEIDGDNYRAVVEKIKKQGKVIKTAYRIKSKKDYIMKRKYCVLDSQNSKSYEEVLEELENEKDYFADLFGIDL